MADNPSSLAPAPKFETGILPDPRSDSLSDVFRDPEKRRKLIDHTNILRGVTITRDRFSPSALLLFTEGTDVTDYAPENYATKRTITVETEVASHSFSQSISNASIAITSPWVSASTGLSLENTSTESNSIKTIYTSSNQLFRHGIIQLDVNYLKHRLHPNFLNRVRAVIGDPNPDPSAKRRSLAQVFDDYGHIFRTRVFVGASLMCQSSIQITQASLEQEMRSDLEASVAVEVAGWGASASGSLATVTRRGSTLANRTVDFQFQANGGDSSRLSNAEAWTESTGSFENWVVVGVDAAIPTIDLLPDDLKLPVSSIFASLIGRWVHLHITEVDSYFQQNPGWYWLNYSGFHLGRHQYLVVKENTQGALGPVNPTPTAIQLSDGRFFTVHTAQLAGYATLGTYSSLMTTDSGALRAVRRDEIMPATAGHMTNAQIQIVQVLPLVSQNVELGINTNSYAIFSRNAQEQWRPGLWTLKKSAVAILNPQDFIPGLSYSTE